MLDLVHRLALRIYPIRLVILALGGLSLLGFVYVLAGGNQAQESYLLPAAALLGWSVCLYGIAAGFRQVPAPASAQAPFLTRLKHRLQRFLAWLLALAFVLTSTGLLFISLRAISLALRAE